MNRLAFNQPLHLLEIGGGESDCDFSVQVEL